MRKIFTYFLIPIIILIQVSLIPYFSVFKVSPNLMIAIVFSLVLVKGFKEYWPVVLVSGLLLDLFSGLPFGLISISLIAASYLIDRLKNDVFGHLSFGIVIVLSIVGTVAFNWLALIMRKLLVFDLSVDWLYNLLYQIPLEVFYNLLFIIIFYYVLRKISYKKQLN